MEDSVGSRTRPPVDGILGAVGDTPLVALRRFLGHRRVDLWAKLEQANPGGSAKARPATLMLREAFASGKVGAETTVIESSSGNMGVGLAQVCRYLGLRFVCVADARTDPIKIRAMEALGADVRVVTRPDPATGDLLAARLRLVAHLLETTPNSYWPDQYANSANPRAHELGTMREIDEALEGNVDYLFVAASTTGTLRGCVDYVRAHDRSTRVVVVDALGSVLFGGRRAPRRLPGFGAGSNLPWRMASNPREWCVSPIWSV